jgi:Holliday junction resolvase-like predicted endonuclease
LIIARNFRWIGTELDILARKEKTLVAVEVKFRSRAPEDMSAMEPLLPRRKLAALYKGLEVAQVRLAPRLHGIMHSRIDLALVTPAQNTKAPPGTGPEGAGESIRPHLAVRWFTAIGG